MKKAIVLLSLIAISMWTLAFFAGDFDGDWLENQFQLEETVVVQEEVAQVQEKPVHVDTEEKEPEVTPEALPVVTPVSTPEASSEVTPGTYAFSRLSVEEQQIYNEILVSLLNFSGETQMSTTNTSVIDKAFSCVMIDHPEIFYVDGYKYTKYSNGDTLKRVTFTGNYIYSKSEIAQRQDEIDEIVAQILANAPKSGDDYLKVKYVFDTIVANTEYDMESPDNQNICSVFLNGRSVCQGYAKAFQYLLQKMDVETSLVIGKVKKGEGHAWNLVKMNGQWYYVDSTWGDAYYLLGGAVEDEIVRSNSINYDYLGVTTEQISATHILEMPVEMPECTAIQDNFYVREGAYLYAYDETKIRDLFSRAYQNGNETVTLKCCDDAVYQEVWSQLIGKQKVFQFLSDTAGTIAYTNNDNQRSITFWL